ncbi:TPA: hypothetical protein I0H43_RS13310 [Enterococcus faecalis]|nr:hypothetical protein [Enterococcus faecalis]
MKVKVCNVPVFYNGQRYEKNTELTINEKYFDSNLFQEMQEKKTTSKNTEKLTDECSK